MEDGPWWAVHHAGAGLRGGAVRAGLCQSFGKVLLAVSQGRKILTQKTQMNANAPVLLDALSNRIIGCALTVANGLGSGFLEKVYENALALELRAAGLAVAQQSGITVLYKGARVGAYFVDLLVEEAVMVELKTVRALDRNHRAQCINYLRATGMHLCLLLNFGTPRLEIRRVVLNL